MTIRKGKIVQQTISTSSFVAWWKATFRFFRPCSSGRGMSKTSKYNISDICKHIAQNSAPNHAIRHTRVSMELKSRKSYLVIMYQHIWQMIYPSIFNRLWLRLLRIAVMCSQSDFGRILQSNSLCYLFCHFIISVIFWPIEREVMHIELCQLWQISIETIKFQEILTALSKNRPPWVSLEFENEQPGMQNTTYRHHPMCITIILPVNLKQLLLHIADIDKQMQHQQQ